MKIINSLFSALLMYSRIPAPMVEWKEENRKYALAFFPVIGIVTGAFLVLWRYVCSLLGFGQILFAAGAVFIPFAVTGGIHIDGFCDVHDALSSCGSREKALEILKDSHIGAFAAIHLGIYLIVQFGIYSETESLKCAFVTGTGFVVSRAMSGLTAVNFRAAKKEGALHAFTDPADRRVTSAVLVMLLAVCMVFLGFVSWPAAVLYVSVCAGVTLYFRNLCYKRFGGITGDCSGWFLQSLEIWFAGAAVLAEKLSEVLL